MKAVESQLEDFNIYCTAADSAVHSLVPIQSSALLRQVKLCSLLGRYTYISCGHVYENAHTCKLLTDNPDLLESGIVAIGLRSDCRDFSDLLAQRRAEGRMEQPSDAAITKFLDLHTSVVIPWTPMDLQPQFKAGILEALQNPDSCLRRRLTATPLATIEELSRRIADLPNENATRTTMHRMAATHLSHRTRAFMREVNLLYYVLGSADKFLRPHLSQSLFSYLDRGCKATNALAHEAPLTELVETTLRKTMLPIHLLDCLSVTQLTHLRENAENELTRFRHKWWQIASLTGSQETFSSSQTEFIDRLAEEVKKEEKRLRAFDTASGYVSVSSLILSGVTLIPHPALAALSFLASMAAFAVSNQAVKHRLLKTDFATLTDRIIAVARGKGAQQPGRG